MCVRVPANAIYPTTMKNLEIMLQPTGPATVVIFGASGDLTRRKLVPALANLRRDHLLPDAFAVVGVAVTDFTTESFREHLADALEEHDPELWDWLAQRCYYLPGDFADSGTYKRLKSFLAEVEAKHGTRGNTLYYLATPPSFFTKIVPRLGEEGMVHDEEESWRRVVVEKPFGHDLASARQLNHKLKEVLAERQIYRIDHYLGKETVQNVLVFRFANGIFEPLWNHHYVDHVQITVAESLGVEHRGGYYEEAGALRDMIPNHLFQLLAIIAMGPPNSFEADAVRDEKEKILQAIQPLSHEEVLTRTVRGQYGEGLLHEGVAEPTAVPGYRQEPRVAEGSNTETYVAMRLMVDNWRWAGVPFYLRTGKRLVRKATEIVVEFKRAPYMLFRDTPVDHLPPNRLTLRIQPDEGIELGFSAKVPAPVLRMGSVDMNFSYSDDFGAVPATGYETLLYDCLKGDATLFRRADNVESAWRVVEPVLDVWSALPTRHFPNYAAGSWGPKEADELLARDERGWKQPVVP